MILYFFKKPNFPEVATEHALQLLLRDELRDELRTLYASIFIIYTVRIIN